MLVYVLLLMENMFFYTLIFFAMFFMANKKIKKNSLIKCKYYFNLFLYKYFTVSRLEGFMVAIIQSFYTKDKGFV